MKENHVSQQSTRGTAQADLRLRPPDVQTAVSAGHLSDKEMVETVALIKDHISTPGRGIERASFVSIGGRVDRRAELHRITDTNKQTRQVSH